MKACAQQRWRIGESAWLFAMLLASLAAAAPQEAAPPERAGQIQGVIDLSGNPVNPLLADAKVVVLIFVDPECPIANRYAPEIQRLAAAHEPAGAKFWLVYPDPDLAPDQMRRHLKEFGYTLPALHDTRGALVKRAGATVTPEAAVFVAGGRLEYRGRIDDRFVALGKQRRVTTRRDLEEAVAACLAGKSPRTRRTEAVGCYIHP